MASIIKLNGKFRAQIRRAGQPTMTKTFHTHDEANEWAVDLEKQIRSGKKVGAHGQKGFTLAQAIDRYIAEKRDIGQTACDVLGRIKAVIGHVQLEKMTDDTIVDYIQGKNFSRVSGAMHYSFLKSVLKKAKVGWKYHVPDILTETHERLTELELLGVSTKRTRRPTEQELKLLLEHDYKTSMPMKDIIQFAIATAMRISEIMRIKYKTLDLVDKTILITDRKHPKIVRGNHKTVPLLDEAIDIIKRQQKKEGNENIFPYNKDSVGNYFSSACKTLGIVDLHFHDLRHEGASRLFEVHGYPIEKVAMFTGHEDWKQLQRYVQLRAKDIGAPPKATKRAAKMAIDKANVVKEGSAPEGGVVMDAETMKQFKQFLAMKKMMEEAA